MTGPTPEVRGARAELLDLCARGLDWRVDPARVLEDPSTARPAAVLVLFGVLDATPSRTDDPVVARDLDVLLQRRSRTLGHHAGQIAFPGGRLEPVDAGPREAALREAVEEVGLEASGVEVLGTLPSMPVPVSNHLVTPVPAWWTRPSQVAAVDHAETVDVFRIPVADLLEPANRASVEHTRWGRTVRTPAFTVGGVLVWGFTGIVLARMFDALGWAVPYDVHRVVQAR
ncbi:CoA pyrophosphatase [Cellulomonas sp. Leaf334]|uniref:NUDIX hydrolase n=1 Tax=Cellulomonas sp. Leaf334 TaxID=1736339 RepID=UPI0006F96CEA|nr:CoA pyrophosphatase [Cellulomonas sp. Leaf334]KQR16333.1 NUDIX hydrolase [Cellulomonas sp. Leaf334]